MANRFQKFIYYISAESPVMIIFALLWILQKSSFTEPVFISWKIPTVLITIAVASILMFNCFFRKAKTDLSILQVTGSEFKCIDGWLFAYVVSYLLPFTSLAIGDVAWIVLVIILILLMLILVFSDYVTPHPLLFCKGYHFYELKTDGLASDYKVISKKQIRNVKDICKVSRVFEFLLIRKG
ncbi:MAG: hypothetical protein Q4A04_01000 [Eubacteriales bacterium]|nr:hypothetical protein [Eubacteriales bacterium]